MSTLETVLRLLHAAGITLVVDGELLRARPTLLVTNEIAVLIRRYKSELMLCLLRSMDTGQCDRCHSKLLPIPTFDGFENLECISCDRCIGCRPVKSTAKSNSANEVFG